MPGEVCSPLDLQKRGEDGHQGHRIEDGLQALGDDLRALGDGLLGQMAGDSRPVPREDLRGDLLGQMGDPQGQEDDLLEDSWSGASVGSHQEHPEDSCSDPGGLRCIRIPGLHSGRSRAASEARSQGRNQSSGLPVGLQGVQRAEDRPCFAVEPVMKSDMWRPVRNSLPVQEAGADSVGSGWSQPSVPVASGFGAAATNQEKYFMRCGDS